MREHEKMNPSLKDFFDEEKKRVFTPDPYFHTRVMARVKEAPARDFSIWDVIPNSTRPVFGLALVLMLSFLAVQFFVPQVPDRGFMDAFLEGEQVPADALVSSAAEMPAQDFVNQLLGFEEQ